MLNTFDSIPFLSEDENFKKLSVRVFNGFNLIERVLI